jgi:hypothetical protein
VGFSSNGARALTGRHRWVVSKVKEVAPDMNWVHCSICREALASKGMPPEFKTVLDNAVKLVNYIKARPLNNSLFFTYSAMKCAVNIHNFCFILKFADFPRAKY